MTALAVNTEATEPNIFFKENQANKTVKRYIRDFKHFEFIGDGKISDIGQGTNDITQETCDTTTCSTKQKLPRKQNHRQKCTDTSYGNKVPSDQKITNIVHKKHIRNKKYICNKKYAKCQNPNCKKHSYKNKNFATVQKTICLEERFKGCKHNHQYFDFMGHGNQIEKIFFTENTLQNATASRELDLTLILRALPVKPKKQVTVFNQTFANLKADHVKWKLLFKPYFVRKKVPHKRLPQFKFYYVRISQDCKEMFKDLPLVSVDFSGAKFSTEWIDKKTRIKSFNQNSMKGMFSGCKYLKEIELGALNTRHVTDMSEMFYNCASLQSIDLCNFNTSKVTTMSKMFANCKNLKHIDLSNFDTANVQEMDSMFFGCESLKHVNLEKIKTDQLKTAFRMLYNCTTLPKIIFSTDYINTGNLINISEMFWGCINIEYIYFRAVNTNYVKFMKDFIFGCKNLQITEYHPLSEAKMIGIERKCSIYINHDDSDESEVEESDSEDM